MDRLQRLRQYFLSFSEGNKPAGAYWQDEQDLALYDKTLGKRIVWKWESVFREFAALQIPQPSGRILDYGCGAGAVGEALLSSFNALKEADFFLWDHSPHAVDFAKKKLKALSPKAWQPDPNEKWDWIFVSHVLNELNGLQKSALTTILRNANYVVLVEPGTFLDFKNLVGLRASLSSSFDFLAPCTHSLKCPLAEHPSDWCHHFAETPSEVYSDPDWARVKEELGIDMSSLPYSYLVMENKKVERQRSDFSAFDRRIGTPRMYKGFAKILSCKGDEGVRELEFQKREDGDIFKSIKKDTLPRVIEWEKDPKSPLRVRAIKNSV